MRKIIASEFLTLDGVMEDPGGGAGSPYGGWSLQYWSEESSAYMEELDDITDTLLLGRVTYDGFAAVWPNMPEADGAERMNSMPKYVVSDNLESADWNNTRIIRGEVADEIRQLKQQEGKDILVYGSGDLIQSLMAHDLIDEFHLWIHPIVVGGGKRLFADGIDRTRLQLVTATTLKTGVIILKYQLAA